MSATAFLLARIAEDEEMARHVWPERYTDRMLADCAARRRVAQAASQGEPTEGYLSALTIDWVVAVLALPYADHPDYRDEWRP